MIKRLLQHVLPLAVSAGLLGWLLYRVPPEKLLEELSGLPRAEILTLSAALVIALYAWDTVCLQTVFASGADVVSYRRMLAVRGMSYLLGAFNYELGQGVVAWNVSRMQGISLLSTVSRSVVLAYHDLTILLSMGLLGALFVEDRPRQVTTVMVVSAIGLVGLIAVALLFSLLPPRKRQAVRATRWGAWLVDWSWGRSSRLIGQRFVYFAILVAYGAVALGVSGIPVDAFIVISTLPFVLLADALPSVSGIGTRETALVLLLNPENQAVLLAVSLIWSSSMVIGRLLIGLVWLWLPADLALHAPET
ncbi:MAG: lysylphosphatidylglycerol synthase domain-containing protein [Planctomycetota bacterium]